MRTSMLLAATSCLVLGIGAAQAADNRPATPPAGAAAPATQMPSQVDAQKLIGRNIQNTQNETIGEIESIMMSPTGKADAVVVGVGGFLGMGKKDVAIKWDQLTIAENGEKVTVPMTKEQLKALPEYTYKDEKYRGKVIPYGTVGAAPDATSPRVAADTRATAPRTDAARTASPAAGAVGVVGASSLVGLDIKNAAGDTIGEIKDVVLDGSGQVSKVMFGTGGVLGLGERVVPVGWDQIRVTRDSNGAIQGTTTLSKEELATLPEYKKEKDAWRPN